MAPVRLWSVSQIADALGLTRQWVAELVASEGFPEPYSITGRDDVRGWRPDDVIAWAAENGRPVRDL